MKAPPHAELPATEDPDYCCPVGGRGCQLHVRCAATLSSRPLASIVLTAAPPDVGYSISFCHISHRIHGRLRVETCRCREVAARGWIYKGAGISSREKASSLMKLGEKELITAKQFEGCQPKLSSDCSSVIELMLGAIRVESGS